MLHGPECEEHRERCKTLQHPGPREEEKRHNDNEAERTPSSVCPRGQDHIVKAIESERRAREENTTKMPRRQERQYQEDLKITDFHRVRKTVHA